MSDELLIFRLEDLRYALPLALVDRVVRAAEVTLLPHAPPVVSGIINLQGQVVAVVDLRRRLGLRLREMALTDEFIVANLGRYTVALHVDSVSEVVSAREVTRATQILPGFNSAAGAIQLGGEVVMLYELEHLLSPAESEQLTLALMAPQ